MKEKLKAGHNELLLHFFSAFLTGRDIEKKHSKNVLWNGDSSRLHVRKAQYKCVSLVRIFYELITPRRQLRMGLG